MDTPITISSTLSSVGKSSKKFTVQNTESTITRVPVSWDSPLKPCDRESSCTPSTLQKVNNWINSLSRLSRDHVERNSGSHSHSSDFSDYDVQNGLGTERDLVSSMIVLPDFNKSELKDQMPEDELDNYCRSSYNYENARETQTSSKILNETMFGGGPRKHLHPKAIKRRNSVQNYNLVEKHGDKSDDYDSDVPLSPESEKKKELYSYLKLMKPSEKKTVRILQNRRSVRVKNLSSMQEKRELEKRMREASAENPNNNGFPYNSLGAEQKYPGLKSFDEMNVDLNKKKYKWLKYSGTKGYSNDSFCFPEPADNLRVNVSNFDEVKISWFRNRKCFSERQHVPWVNQFKEKKENKKNGTDVMSQENKFKKKVEMNKPHINDLPEHIQVKETKREAVKNICATVLANSGIKRRGETKEYNAIRDNKLKKVVEVNKKSDDKNGLNKKKEDTIETNFPQSQLNGSSFEKARLQSLASVTETQFLIPKPSTHFVHDVNDFDVIITRNRELLKNNAAISFSMKVRDNNEAKLLDSSDAVVVPSFPVNPQSEDIKAEGKVLNTSKTKVHPPKKKSYFKKLKSERKVQKSSFKIKLKPRRKSLSSQGRNDKKLTRSKFHLISDIMRSLRNRNVENPSSDINLLKKNVPKNKQKFMNKKENLKQKVENSKEQHTKPTLLENNMEVVLKTPLKDTNKNPVKSTNLFDNTVFSSKDITRRIIEGDSKPTMTEEASPKSNSVQNSMSDIDFCNLSTQHKSSLFVKNMIQHDSRSPVPIIAIYHKNNSSNGLDSSISLRNKFANTQEKGEFYSQILNIEKYPEEDSISDVRKQNIFVEEVHERKTYAFKNNENQTSLLDKRTDDSELRSSTSINKECVTPISSKSDKIHTTCNEVTPFISFKRDVGVKSLHKCLNILTQKNVSANLEVENSPTSWPSESPSHKRKKSQHSINIFKEHGSVLKAFYLEYNLVLCQEFMVSFWTQTALGNVLGAQNMWIHKGSIQRMAMSSNCIFKESLEMVVSTCNNVAYIELWTKEHQSDIREGPVADVFATVYFWKKGQNGLDKKVLQLENINGFADDVQYSVLKSTAKIIVSWHLACSELENKKTYIHCYQLSPDYQTVYNISEFEAVEHYVSSLHNIEGCDSLIMGCGENKITLWNIEHGYIVTTIEMSEIKSPLSTLWVKCDRGFLFTLQQCVDRELRLIAIHGMNHSWKKLASYVPPDEYDRLKGVCVENGIVLAFYEQGILCWNAQTAETIVEESHNEAEYISGKYVISVVNDQVNIRHAITHLLSAEDS